MVIVAISMGNLTVVRVRAALTTESDGSYIRDWDGATSTAINGCMIQPFQLSSRLQIEMNLDREFSSAYFRFWFPPGTDIQSTDRLVFNGNTYEVYGVPGTWFDQDGTEHHVTCLAIQRRG